MRKGIALLAITGMLTTPAAMAQNDLPGAATKEDRPDSAVQAPNSGGSSGFKEATGFSSTALTVSIAAALALAIALAADSDSSSSSGTK